MTKYMIIDGNKWRLSLNKWLLLPNRCPIKNKRWILRQNGQLTIINYYYNYIWLTNINIWLNIRPSDVNLRWKWLNKLLVDGNKFLIWLT